MMIFQLLGIIVLRDHTGYFDLLRAFFFDMSVSIFHRFDGKTDLCFTNYFFLAEEVYASHLIYHNSYYMYCVYVWFNANLEQCQTFLLYSNAYFLHDKISVTHSSISS